MTKGIRDGQDGRREIVRPGRGEESRDGEIAGKRRRDKRRTDQEMLVAQPTQCNHQTCGLYTHHTHAPPPWEQNKVSELEHQRSAKGELERGEAKAR